MKNIFIAVLAATAVFTAANVAQLSGAASTPKESRHAKGGAFDMSGTVTRDKIDLCGVIGLRYWLHPKKGEAARLKPAKKHDLLVLDEAVKNRSSVHVTGTWDEAMECNYVNTSKVENAR